VKLRTIINIAVDNPFLGGAATAKEAWPSVSLFRMGAPPHGGGEWERWGWALLLAAIIHAGAVLAGIAILRPPPKASPKAEEPELVALTFMAPRPPAQSVPAAAPVPEQKPRPARPRLPRPIVAPPPPAPLPTKPPEPEPTAAPPVDDEADLAPEDAPAVAGVVAGLMGNVMDSRQGSPFGVSDGALELKQVARAPQVLDQVKPRYPRQARSQGIVGLVLVRVIVGIDGRVEPEHTRIIRSIPALDEAAIAAVSQWRFTPAIGRQGKPVRVIIEIPIQFSPSSSL
jgi:periplasmic protein TonB